MLLSPASRERLLGGLWGGAVGDALGVPAEFCSREARKEDPITGMRGYGTHNQPPGTWSDDTALTLCTIEGLLETSEYLTSTAGHFVRWFREGHWTPHGEVFDAGSTTVSAIQRLAKGVNPTDAGGTGEHDNGNGSLMRILPVALWCAGRDSASTLEMAHKISALTHRHPRSLVACGFYCLVAQELLKGYSPADSLDRAWATARLHYSAPPYAEELSHFRRLLPGSLKSYSVKSVRGTGYVVETLEASLWCLLRESDFESTILCAINLGEDTDTVGAITGGLAGLVYGIEGIPADWRRVLARADDVEALFTRFVNCLLAPCTASRAQRASS